MNLILKRSWKHALAVLGFFLVTLVYFTPNFEGKVLNAHDNLTSKGNSKEIIDHMKIYDEQPFWTNGLFSGMPAFHISTISYSNLMRYVYNSTTLGMKPVHNFFMYMIGFYILLLVLGMSPFLSAIGAISFALSTYFVIIIGAGHNTKAAAIAYMAPIIAGVLLTFRKKYLLGAAITAFFLAIEIAANHLQITYYLMFILLIYGGFKLYEAIKINELPHLFKSLLFLIIAVFLAVGANSTKLMLSLEYTKDSTRGRSELTADSGNKTSGLDKDYVTAWSYGIWESFTLVIPNFQGGASGGELDTKSATYDALKSRGVPNARSIIKQVPIYWGDQPMTSGPVYVGAIICFLFVLGLFLVQGPMKWWLLSATILSIVLSWGKHFMLVTDFFLDYVPLYNKFRSVSMTLVIAELTMPLLGFVVIKEMIERKISEEKVLKSIKMSAIITGGICLIFALVPGAFFDFSSSSDAQLMASGWPQFLIDALQQDRESLLKSDAIRSLAFILLGAALLWLYVKGKVKQNVLMITLLGLVLIDLWPINKRYVNNDDFAKKKQSILTLNPSNADLSILQREFSNNEKAQQMYQTLVEKAKIEKKETGKPGNKNLNQNELLDLQFTALNFNSNFRVMNLGVNTFNDASTGYFHKSIGGYHGAKMKRYQELVSFQLAKRNQQVINMLNTKYIIVPGNDKQLVAQQNPGALGNAWYVENYKLVANADEEMAELSDFNPTKTAIVDKRYAEMLINVAPEITDVSGSIELLEYKPNRLLYKSTSNADAYGLVVFSEIFYQPGWNAYIDGKLTDHFRVNYVLRSMVVPSGEHQIEFKFEPSLFSIGEGIALASSSLLLLFFIGSIFFEIRSLFSKESSFEENV